MACFGGVEEIVVFVAPNSLRHSSIIAATRDRYAGDLARRGLSLNSGAGQHHHHHQQHQRHHLQHQQHQRHPAQMRSGAGSSVSQLNERDASAHPLTIKANMRFSEFLKLAGRALAVSGPRRVFMANGREIWTVRDLSHGNTAYISSGEPFYRQLSIDLSAEHHLMGGGGGGGGGGQSQRGANSSLGARSPFLAGSPPSSNNGRGSGHFDGRAGSGEDWGGSGYGYDDDDDEDDDDGIPYNEARLFISVLGAHGSGKSSIVKRLLKGSNFAFSEGSHEPTIEDAYRKGLYVDNVLDNVEVLDTSGQDQFKGFRQQWMSDKDAYVFVFSLRDRASFEALEPYAKMHFALNGTRRRTPPLVLVGNKCDGLEEGGVVEVAAGNSLGGHGSDGLSVGVGGLGVGVGVGGGTGRAVTREEAVAKLDEWRARFGGTDIAAADMGAMAYFEASAKTGANVELAFHCAVREIRRQRRRHNEASRRKRSRRKRDAAAGRRGGSGVASSLSAVVGFTGGLFRCCAPDEER